MVKLIKEGNYKLIETIHQNKILVLDDTKRYAWINVKGIGEMLVSTHVQHKSDTVLSIGSYRIYSVKKEPKLTDLLHIELCVGRGVWQGYLLLSRLPTNSKKKTRIIPTDEVITQSTFNCC